MNGMERDEPGVTARGAADAPFSRPANAGAPTGSATSAGLDTAGSWGAASAGYGTAAEYDAAEPRPRRESGPSVMALLHQLIGNAATLFRKELAMATSEVLHSVQDVKAGVGGMVSGAAVLYAGLIFLLLAATLGLALVVEGWLAALIVGGAVTLIGLIMVQAAKRKLRPASFKPERTVESLRKDREMIGRQA